MDPSEDRARREAGLLAGRALWEDLARKARGLHCPEHLVEPWRVVVIGETRETLRLQIYGCCPGLQRVISAMIDADPRVSGPR